jgi:hypothetical protein
VLLYFFNFFLQLNVFAQFLNSKIVVMNSTINLCQINRFKKHPIVQGYLKNFELNTLKKLKCPYKKGFYILKERPTPETLNATEYGIFIPSLFRIQHDLERVCFNSTTYTMSNRVPIMIVNMDEVWSAKIET